eukprot:2622767-Amphidinium_carterae.1
MRFLWTRGALAGKGAGPYEGFCLYHEMDYGKGHHAKKALLMGYSLCQGPLFPKGGISMRGMSLREGT